MGLFSPQLNIFVNILEEIMWGGGGPYRVWNEGKLYKNNDRLLRASKCYIGGQEEDSNLVKDL